MSIWNTAPQDKELGMDRAPYEPALHINQHTIPKEQKTAMIKNNNQPHAISFSIQSGRIAVHQINTCSQVSI